MMLDGTSMSAHQDKRRNKSRHGKVNRCTNVLEERDSGAAVVSFPWQLMYALKVKRLAAKGKKNNSPEKSITPEPLVTGLRK